MDETTEAATGRAASGDLPTPAPSSDRTRETVTAALLAALLAASAWVAIPVGTAVPVTLQVFIVLLAGLLLTARGAISAVGVYLLLGAAGLPVFSSGLGGWGVLLGPRGGYLWGFAAAAGVVALLRTRFADLLGKTASETVALATGVFVIYALGWAQLAAVTGMGLLPAFFVGVLPFIPPDALKAVAALGVVRVLRRAGAVR